MHTNIDIDKNLLEEALALGRCKTKKAVVNQALSEFVRTRKQMRIVDLFGKIEFDPDYDYKAARKMR
jgi:Arc/MetJ family transcription regulator